MKRSLLLLPLAAAVALAGCNTEMKKQFAAVQHADSMRADSIMQIKNEMLDEVMQSTQFLNDINSEVAKLKVQPTRKLATAPLARESELSKMREERAAVTERIRELIARLDSSEARLASLRQRASTLSARDAQLTEQVAQYEKTIGDLRSSLEAQRAEFQQVVDRQNAQIASLNLKIDTVTKENVKLAGQTAALTDTVSQLVVEKNTVYYVVGTKAELIKQGILVEEGRKSMLVVGSRPVALARNLDPAKFVKIDRLRDRQIDFPAGEYSIMTRQSLSYVTPVGNKNGKLTGGIRVEDPIKFWEPSRFLVIVRN